MLKDFLAEPKNKIIQQIVENERSFCQNNYNGDQKKKDVAEVVHGKIPVILSTPHSVNHTREDGTFKEVDTFTGGIGQVVQRYTGCSLVYLAGSGRGFKVRQTRYRNALRAVMPENEGRVFLIDLHGAKKGSPFDVDLGTLYGKSISSHFVEEIKEKFLANGISDVRENFKFSAGNKTTVTNYAYNHLKIPAVQMEVEYRFRDANGDATSVWALTKSLVEIIEFLSR